LRRIRNKNKPIDEINDENPSPDQVMTVSGEDFLTKRNEEIMPDTKPYKVLSPIDHNGKKFPIGSSIELEPEQAIALLKSKVIAGDLPPVKKSQREAELEAIIAGLRLDMETAARGIAEMSKENAALKERNTELARQIEKLPPKGKGGK
jgi:hypothetical protein